MKHLTLWSASYYACVLYTITIIHLSSVCGLVNIHHYSPPLWWIIVTVPQYMPIFIQEHYKECGKYQVECPHGCGAKMQREKVNWDIPFNSCFYHFVSFFKEYVFSLHCFLPCVVFLLSFSSILLEEWLQIYKWN